MAPPWAGLNATQPPKRERGFDGDAVERDREIAARESVPVHVA